MQDFFCLIVFCLIAHYIPFVSPAISGADSRQFSGVGDFFLKPPRIADRRRFFIKIVFRQEKNLYKKSRFQAAGACVIQAGRTSPASVQLCYQAVTGATSCGGFQSEGGAFFGLVIALVF
ncbi:MAG: hypothetical protein LBS31_08440 [Candidatus Adiutrix sp.]|jgi:hypothetical protein|nr:hypothetical protein [Candidatus Adiutrix sp.]